MSARLKVKHGNDEYIYKRKRIFNFHWFSQLPRNQSKCVLHNLRLCWVPYHDCDWPTNGFRSMNTELTTLFSLYGWIICIR